MEVVAVRAVAYLVVPVTIVVIVYVVVAMASLFLTGARRTHALRVMNELTGLARVVRPRLVVRPRGDGGRDGGGTRIRRPPGRSLARKTVLQRAAASLMAAVVVVEDRSRTSASVEAWEIPGSAMVWVLRVAPESRRVVTAVLAQPSRVASGWCGRCGWERSPALGVDCGCSSCSRSVAGRRVGAERAHGSDHPQGW